MLLAVKIAVCAKKAILVKLSNACCMWRWELERVLFEWKCSPKNSSLRSYRSPRDCSSPSWLPALTATKLLGKQPRKVPARTPSWSLLLQNLHTDDGRDSAAYVAYSRCWSMWPFVGADVTKTAWSTKVTVCLGLYNCSNSLRLSSCWAWKSMHAFINSLQHEVEGSAEAQQHLVLHSS